MRAMSAHAPIFARWIHTDGSGPIQGAQRLDQPRSLRRRLGRHESCVGHGMRAAWALLVLVVPVAVGCASVTEDEATAKGQPSAIINGTLAPNSAFRSVVRIDEGCTATQIAPRLLLTASHCIRTPRGEVSPSYAKGRSLTVESRGGGRPRAEV
jgi:hypothetical protein